MPRIFVESRNVEGGSVRIDGEAADHLSRSLRVRPGEVVVVVEEAAIEHGVRLESVQRHRVSGTVLWSRPAGNEPALRTHVLQALPQRGLDDSVELLSQLGVSDVHPLLSARTITRPGADAVARRVRRWNAIAREAAQLAGRSRAPVVHAPTVLESACAALPPGSLLLVAAPSAARPLASVRIESGQEVALLIGPEGGWEEAELDALRRRGATGVHLGPRVLPARYAAGIALALLLAAAGELGDAPQPLPKI